MASFNKVILIGHLTADPELKQTTSGVPVTSFSIGVNRRLPDRESSRRPISSTSSAGVRRRNLWHAISPKASRFLFAARSRPVRGSIRTATSAIQPKLSPTRRRLSSASRILQTVRAMRVPYRSRAASPPTGHQRSMIRLRSFPRTTNCRFNCCTQKRAAAPARIPAWKGWFHYG